MSVRVQLAFTVACAVGCGDTVTTAKAALNNADCQRCHVDVATSWARSRHHHAFDNPDFQRSYTEEPKPFCRDCHAPGGLNAAAEGVSCLHCHASEHGVVTGPGLDRDAPHPVSRSATFGTDTCARCHEFEFPPDSRRPEGTMMQRTMAEHQASTHANKSCADCHLPQTELANKRVIHDHSLASTRDPDAMRRALLITAKREGNDLVLSLVPQDVGHAFPTGDLYRRLEIGAELHAGGKRVASATRYLARHFAPWRLEDGALNPAFEWSVPDDRFAGPTAIRLALNSDVESGSAALTWWVDYQRVDERNAEAPQRSSIADEIRLAEGRL
ncbi:MAG: hypothetical protein JKY37_11980 [Nannocystaceae bacterium]|nr:hypothetical protein [Nannocystaceae bacterium]